MDPEVRLGNPYFKNPSLKNFSPRIGFAWDLFGDGKSSLRGGFGLFFDQILTNYYSAPIQQSPPNIRVTLDFPRDKEDNFPNDFFTLPPLDQIKLGPWIIFDPVQPYIMQWSLTLQRELFQNAVLTLGYTGSRGVHLGRFLDANTAFGERQADGRWFFEAGLPRRNPVFGRMRATVWDASSWYNAMRVSFQKRFSQGYQFQISYNFSRMIDEGNGTSFFDRGSGGDSTQMTFFDDVHMDRGLSGFNTSHSFTANYTVELPGENLTGALGQILGGWTASGIISAASGETMTLTMSFDRARLLTGNRNLRPDAVPGVDPVVGNLPDNYFGEPEDVKNAFTVPERGYFGNLGRGTVTGPDRFTLDFALLKKTKLTEGANLQFRAEVFNILNNVNFSNPGSRVFDRSSGRVSSSFGISSRTVNTSRQIQFALKILF